MSTTTQRTFKDEILSDSMAVILRARTPAERLAIAFRMWAFARQLVRRTAQAEHPEWGDATLERHVAQRMSHGTV
jgi:hypothetical protein